MYGTISQYLLNKCNLQVLYKLDISRKKGTGNIPTKNRSSM